MTLEMPAGVPMWALIGGAVLLALLAILGCWLLVVASRNRRERRRAQALQPATGDVTNPKEEKTERRVQRLVNTAAAICVLLYLGLFASSFQAIAGFAKEFLKREGFMVPATPLTLDGVVIGALFLSLAFVAKHKSPAKANTLIWGMTLFAAYCGFTYGDSGDHGSFAAGLYYAVMSIVGMFMFHMVLDLFQETGDYVKSKYPSMGWRWITHWSTVPVMLAWINHPPRSRNEKTRPAVREAIDHWRHVKTIRSRAASIEASARHARKLASAQRSAELAVARAAAGEAAKPVPAPAPVPVATAAPVASFTVPAPVLPPAIPVPTVPTNGHAPAHHGHNGHNGHPASATTGGYRTVTAPVVNGVGSVPVPNTAQGVSQWLANWMTICEVAPEVALQQVKEPSDEDCKTRFEFSYKQMQKVRKAARTGALRARAREMDVDLPEGYADGPQRVNGAVAQPVG